MRQSLRGFRPSSSPSCSRLATILVLAISLVPLIVEPPVAQSEEQCLICRQRHAEAEWLHHESFGIDLDGPGPRYAPDRHFDVKHIRLDVTPNFERHTVHCVTSITLQPIANPQDQIRLDAIHLTIHRVWSDDVEVADFTVTSNAVTVQLKEPLAVDQQATIHFDHQAQPERGFYFRTPDMGYPESDTHVWTQGEAHEARYWFPCFDYPNERSTTEVICHVPSDMTVLSNGRLVSETVSSETGLKTSHWLQEKPHVNYLICLVAGYLEKLEDQHGDIPLAFFSQPTLAEHAANSFQDTAQIMAFFEEEIGVAYPWNKYYQVTIRDFVAGGMENTTLTTLTHNTIFSSDTENLRSTRRLDAHELAHQWFGNYVTCKDWSHLWLNEGFATYYAHLYEGHKFGDDALRYGLYQDARRSILTQASDKRPIVYRGYSNAREQFDYRVYPKGSWVLHMLRSQLGEDLFRRSVREYLERHALTSVVTEDLRKVLEELSGLPLDQFFDQWLYHARFPDLTVRYEWLPDRKLARVEVKQTHEVSSDVLLFSFPTKLRFVFDGLEPIETEIRIHRDSHEFFIPLPQQPTLVRFDPEYTLLARTEFPKPDAMLLVQSTQADDMIGRLLATEALGKRKTRDAIDRLGEMLREDSFFGVRIGAAEALRSIGNDAAFQQLRQSLEQTDARVRREVAKALADHYREETPTLLQEMLQSESNPLIRADLLQAMAKFPLPETRQLILSGLRTDSLHQDELTGSIQAIAAQNDPSLHRPLIRMLETRGSQLDTPRLRSALSAAGKLGRFASNKTALRELISDYLHDPRDQVKLAAIRGLGDLGDPMAESVLQSFQNQTANQSLSDAARSALNTLSEQKPVTPAEVVELRRLVQELKESRDQFSTKLEQLESKTKAQASQTEKIVPSQSEEKADGAE
jgi:aminopeptidase N